MNSTQVINILNKNPGKLRAGVRILIDSNTFILALLEETSLNNVKHKTYSLISLYDGNRWVEPKKIPMTENGKIIPANKFIEFLCYDTSDEFPFDHLEIL